MSPIRIRVDFNAMATDATPGNGVPAADERATILAEMAAAKEAESKVAAEETDSQDEAVEEADEESAEVESDGDTSDDDEEEASDDEESDEDEATSDDPKVAKGLDQVRRAEKRNRERLEADKRSLAAERDQFIAEWTPKVEQAERFAKLKESLPGNPYAIVDLLIEAGVSEDDFEAAAQAAYAHSTKGKAEPKNKDAILKSKENRELRARLEAVEKREAEREKAAKDAAEHARLAAEGAKILDSYATTVKAEKSPLLAAAMAKNPAKTRDRLTQIVSELWDSTGARPKVSAVHAAYEKMRREELAELDIDPATVIKAKPGKPGKPGVPAKPAANTNGAKKALTDEEIIAEMASLS